MAKKLFALEEAGLEVAGVELETAPEEGEVADVQAEVQEDVAEVQEIETGIEEGMDAADQLEEVQEVAQKAAEQEGLDPVAAEALRVAVEAICARVGANPKAVYSLYATENFQSASARKANTKIALEGVREFLKDLWKKIKAALARLWAKVKAFWDKHISSLGRVKKALEAMKAKVASSSGKLEKTYLEEAPGSILHAFGHTGEEISARTIGDVITNHEHLSASADEIAAKITSLNEFAKNKTLDPSALKDIVEIVSTESGPLVGGVTFKIEVEVDNDEGTVQINFSEEAGDEPEKKGLQLATKDAVKGVLDKTLAIINDNIKAREKLAKLEDSFNKASTAVEKAINDTVTGKETAEQAKELRKTMKVIYAMNAKAPVVFNKTVSYNIKLAKAVLGYAAFCVKNYK